MNGCGIFVSRGLLHRTDSYNSYFEGNCCLYTQTQTSTVNSFLMYIILKLSYYIISAEAYLHNRAGPL